MKLNLVKAFHQFQLHPDSRPLTTTLMPLGLKDSRAVCQWLVQETLADLGGVVSYIEDILIFVETIEAHDNLLEQVL